MGQDVARCCGGISRDENGIPADECAGDADDDDQQKRKAGDSRARCT